MILPSDEDARKPDDDDTPPPWQGEPEVPGFFEDTDEDEPGEATVHNPAPEGWREDLKEDLADALAELKEIEDPAEDFDPPEPPDLFAFYGELVAMRNEFRLSLEASMMGTPMMQATSEVMIGLIKLYDEMEAAEAKLLPLLKPVLKAAGLTRVKVKAGAAFDPATMVTEDKRTAGSRVARELGAGWLWNEKVVRPAKVALK